MTKPNAVEKMMARRALVQCIGEGEDLTEWLEDFGNFPESNLVVLMRSAIAALDAAGLAIVPYDWNHREEDWSLQSVSEWLER